MHYEPPFHPRLVALTKRALEAQLQRAGATRREAEFICARLQHEERWARLSTRNTVAIALKMKFAKRIRHG